MRSTFLDCEAFTINLYDVNWQASPPCYLWEKGDRENSLRWASSDMVVSPRTVGAWILEFALGDGRYMLHETPNSHLKPRTARGREAIKNVIDRCLDGTNVYQLPEKSQAYVQATLTEFIWPHQRLLYKGGSVERSIAQLLEVRESLNIEDLGVTKIPPHVAGLTTTNCTFHKLNFHHCPVVEVLFYGAQPEVAILL